MTALDLMLPEHLFRETRNQDGEVTGVTYLHDRLVNWFDRGKGSQDLCQTVYQNELSEIASWEDNRLLLLEEQWLEVENGEDDDDIEAQYHLDCDAVTREAGERRAAAELQMTERQTSIEALVSQCAEHIEEHAPARRPSHVAEYLLAMAVLGALTYVMI